MADTMTAYCRTLLLSPDLESKLVPPIAADGGRLTLDVAAPEIIAEPGRAPHLAMTAGHDKLPKRKALRERSARARCLERFAGHELQAVELFAWALLAFPSLPDALKRGLLQTLAEEQLHLSLYLDRLKAHGGALGDTPLSSYFWRTVPGCLRKPDPELAFLCGMGLTLEQANLDFTLHYRDAFADAGDHETAEVIQKVHDDEIRHVRLAAVWMRRLADKSASPPRDSAVVVDEVTTYEAAVPFPLAANRAKGRQFSREARQAAWLSEPFIDYIDAARPHQVLPERLVEQANVVAIERPPPAHR